MALVGHLQQTRPAYYDRGAANTLLAYTATAVAPHAATVRATYTVPTGKRAYIDSARVEIINQTPAAGGGIAFLTVNLNSATEGTNVMCGHIQDRVGGTWATGFWVSQVVGAIGLIVAGDTVRIISSDGAATGNANYRAFSKIAEFDV